MSLLDHVKAQHLASRKAKDAVATGVLSIVLSEVQVREKAKEAGAITDEVVVSVIKKQIESTKELLEAKRKANRPINEEERSLEILRALLPSELSRAELEAEITELVGNQRDVKLIKPLMTQLKAKGLAFDNKMLSDIMKGG